MERTQTWMTGQMSLRKNWNEKVVIILGAMVVLKCTDSALWDWTCKKERHCIRSAVSRAQRVILSRSFYNIPRTIGKCVKAA